MPTIKDELSRRETVRLFGVGQLIGPKLVEIVGLHGGFDGLWLDFGHAGFTTKDVEPGDGLRAARLGIEGEARHPVGS
jgi:4-hydroxy-2-oxoheptanedioate aldolase